MEPQTREETESVEDHTAQGLDNALADEAITPPVKHVLKYFKFKHLPEHLRSASERFAALAIRVARGPQNPETTVALRKLLEAKDAAVRAVL